MHFAHLASTLLKDEESHDNILMWANYGGGELLGAHPTPIMWANYGGGDLPRGSPHTNYVG